MSLSNAPSTSNVSENWIAQFTADNKHCLEFDGTDDNINFGNILSTPFVNFTIEFWANADDIGSGVVIQLSSGSGEDEDENASFNVNLQSGGEFQLFYEYGSGSNESNITSDFNLSADTWTHVAVVRDDATGEAYFYKNGVLVETETAANDPTGGTSADADLTIGNSFNNNNGFDGELAHVRVWNTARSAADILQYMNRTVVGTESGLKGYWKLNEGTGTSVDDLTSNDNDGTISGATWSINGFDKFIFDFGLSFLDTIVDNDHHNGSILNKSITIRDSIDLTKSTSSTGNISLTSANFKTGGTDFYKTLFNGTNNYHNKEVRLYAQFSGETTLSNCQRIFTGRLVDITLDQNQNIRMQINSHRPWDKIEFPQDVTAITKTYIPTVYGAFTGNQSFYNTPAFCDKLLYPVPVLNHNKDEIHTLMPRSYLNNSYSHINIYQGHNTFLPFATAAGAYIDTTETVENTHVLRTLTSRLASGFIRAQEMTDPAGSGTFFSNTHYAFDGDSTTFSTAAFTNGGNNLIIGLATPPKLFATHSIQKIKITHKSSVNSTFTLYAFPSPYSVNLSTSLTFSADTELTTTFDVSGMGGGVVATGLPWSLVYQETGAVGGTVSISDIQVHLHLTFYSGDDDYDDREQSELGKIKYFYSGGAGLPASWDSDAISHGHDAHRDMLIRFAGVSTEDPEVNTGEAWSVLNTDRAIDNWKVRYWQLEPTSLKGALDKMAYESGFVSKFSPSNQLKYIYVKKSSELSALLNLTKDDIANVSVSTTGIDNVHATMDISNQPHPAESGKYGAVTRATDASLITKYNLGDKEGIAAVNLDMNVGTIPTTADADCNADWYSYMNNIIGDMKILVNCQVVNPAKGYQLETGDIVTFTDMPVEMFGTDFATDKYFMIIETKRSPGKVNITAREVG